MEILSNIPGAEHGRAKRGWEEMERRSIGTSEESLNPFRFPRPSSSDSSLAGPSAFEWGKAGSDYRIFKSEPLHSDLSSFLGIETATGQRNYFITAPNKLPGELKHRSA